MKKLLLAVVLSFCFAPSTGDDEMQRPAASQARHGLPVSPAHGLPIVIMLPLPARPGKGKKRRARVRRLAC